MNLKYKILLYLNLFKYFLKDKFVTSLYKDKYKLFIINHFKKRKKGFYIDVGCYHPIRLSNTNFLYNKGWSGINIDISKKSIDLFNIARKQDINLNLGVGAKNNTSTGYFHKNLYFGNTLNYNHSKKLFNNVLKKKIKTFKLENIINKYAKNKKIDFLDIDCEGDDYDVLKGLNLKKNKIDLISIEMHNYNSEINQKSLLIFKLMKKNQYKLVYGKYPGTLIFKNIKKF